VFLFYCSNFFHTHHSSSSLSSSSLQHLQQLPLCPLLPILPILDQNLADICNINRLFQSFHCTANQLPIIHSHVILQQNPQCQNRTVAHKYMCIHPTRPQQCRVKRHNVIRGENEDPLAPTARSQSISEVKQTRHSNGLGCRLFSYSQRSDW